MATQSERRIVQELLDEPHVKGRRISVLQLRDLVEQRGLQPKTIADRYDLDVADVYRALAYYHEHPAEMQSVRERRAASKEAARTRAREQRPSDVNPPSDGQ